MRSIAALCAAAFLAAGCGEAAERVVIPAAKPPAPSTWPAYPDFPQRSCWSRVADLKTIMRAAPSYVSTRKGKVLAPEEIVRRLLTRFGDRRYVREIRIAKAPPREQTKGFFPGDRRPPRDALWAYLTVDEYPEDALAQWETSLIEGALGDDFCSAGGRSLVGASVDGMVTDAAQGQYAMGQRFPNPSPAEFRVRVEAIGKKYSFRVESLRLLRPRQLAPLLVVETYRDRRDFVEDVRAIMALLDPMSHGSRQSAITFEGFFLEARDADGPFVRVFNVYRGEIMGGQWSADPCAYPYEHTHLFGSDPCAARASWWRTNPEGGAG